MANLFISNLQHSYGTKTAISQIDLELREDNLTIIGPSGCGKTTLLRIVAGLERPDSGQVWIDNDLVAGQGHHVPPWQRSVGMIFQDLALWPHLTVEKNISLALENAGFSKSDRQMKTAGVLERMQLSGFEKKYPESLSAGERQRVALARSMIIEPKLLLLDEPFAHLDLTLRAEMIGLVLEQGRVTVFVTHDQGDAAAMGGMIAVMNAGAIEQSGTWEEIIKSPATDFVKKFTRSSMAQFVNRQ